MFDGFARKRIRTSGAEIALVQGGSGPPLLLLHGYPQTHVIWHKVAPRLAAHFTLVIPDLRGYGASSKPPTDAQHLPYSKRAMALDMAEVMTTLGFDRFAVAGHDRGGRVTYRLALDHPQRVRRVVVLDILPTLEQFERMDRAAARRAYHWFFLTQPVASLLFVYTLLNSAISSVVHGGVLWRGTTYRLSEIQATNEITRREGEERRRRFTDSSYAGPERRRPEPTGVGSE